jgi:hypothetical protein
VWPFDRFILRRERQFSSYDNCPEIYYRFNGKRDYGPRKLDIVVKYLAGRAGEAIEGRFADEETWRPLSYFLDLWQQVPPSKNTIRRLKRENIAIDDTVTEPVGRKLVRERQCGNEQGVHPSRA